MLGTKSGGVRRSRDVAACLGLAWLLACGADAGLGAEARVPWTTSHVEGSPEPPKPYVARRVAPKVMFNQALEIVYDAVSHRWFVLEQTGKMFTLPHDGDPDHGDLAADIHALHPDLDYLYSIAFHPKYAENHYVYVTYTRGAGLPEGTKLSRFVMQDVAGVPHLDGSSEKVILTWRSGGHNGANIRFGPDGFLYVSTGDSEVPSPPDPLNTGQDISDLLSSILRIDVDHGEGGKGYATPRDNPFVDLPKARPEVWAYGLRNPWKMSFDRATGRLWCGDVGWELWEMIHLIERGGNYGWSAMEASQPVRADAPKAPTPIRAPIVAHSHDEAASITGGVVYHGKRFPELEGAYLYGDWETGKMWALWYDGKQVTRHEEIADTHHKIVAFGQDAEGEVVYVHYGYQGTVHELERRPATNTRKFPTRLSDTGLFDSVNPLRPAPGVYEFTVAAPMWQEGTQAWFHVGLPGSSMIHTEREKESDKGSALPMTYKLVWPAGSVLAKTVWTEIRDGVGEASRRRMLETQLMHYDGAAWNAYAYRWNEAHTDATLVPAIGEKQPLPLGPKEGPGASAAVWTTSARSECLRCHNSWCGYALAFTPAHLAFGRMNGGSAVEEMRRLGLVDEGFVQQSGLLGLRDAKDASASLEARARSYLHANCSHCHRQAAGGAVNMVLNAELLPAAMRALDTTPQQGGLGLAQPKLIDPGHPWSSVICVRVAKSGMGHMPIIGPHEIDPTGLRLMEDWIASLKGATSASDLLPKAWTREAVAQRLASVEGAMEVLRAVDEGALAGELRVFALESAWQSSLATVRDLFDRFIPADRRVETLGANPDPETILRLKGNASRGALLLSVQGKMGVCLGCHSVAGAGRDFGPDLTHVGSRLKRELILESVLLPSKVIAPGYAAVTVALKDGSSQLGFVVKEDSTGVTLKLATGQSVTLVRSDIASQTKLPISLMPEGLMQSATAQEAADLVSYLEGLK